MSTGVMERELPTTAAPISAETESRRAITALVVLGAMPLLFWHLVQVLQKPHYQFLVFLPAAMWGLAKAREPATSLTRTRAWLAAAIAVLSVAGLGAATYAWSPWLGCFSALLGAPALWWWVGGWGKFREWRDVWAMAWLMLPIPFGWDERLITGLREWTTRLASGLLDQLGILHQQYAHIIELPGKKLFVADACSGIHSLYVLMATSLFLGLWMNRRWWHIALLMAATFVIVLIENVSRISLIAAGVGWQVDLTQGIGHTLLGLALFCLSLLLIASCDQLLLFPFPQRRSGTVRDARARAATSPARWLLIGRSWAAASLAVAAAGLVLMPKSLPAWSAFVPSTLELEELGEDFLPADLAGFQRLRYSTETRVAGEPLGKLSQQWTYARDDLMAIISVDYPYETIHDLTQCYAAIGWDVALDESRVVPDSELSSTIQPTQDGASAVVAMSRPLFGNGLLIFSLVDAAGKPMAVLKAKSRGTAVDEAQRRLAVLTKRPRTSLASHRGPYVQIQLHARGIGEMSGSRREALETLYLAARDRLLPRCAAALQAESR